MEKTKRTYRQKNEAMELLKDYLGQYQRAKRRRKHLEQRLKEIQIEMQRPIGGINYDPINKSQNRISVGSASFALNKSDIEIRIYAQKEKVDAALMEIMDILNYLDENSDERNALELYYIDGYKWERVADEMCVSRSQVYNLREAGLKDLLTYKRVQHTIENYKAKIDV